MTMENFICISGEYGVGNCKDGVTGKYDSSINKFKPEEMAVLPRMAKLNSDMKSFAEGVKELKIVDKDGKLFTEKRQ
jgi:hypothetical protein